MFRSVIHITRVDSQNALRRHLLPLFLGARERDETSRQMKGTISARSGRLSSSPNYQRQLRLMHLSDRSEVLVHPSWLRGFEKCGRTFDSPFLFVLVGFLRERTEYVSRP
jgi:hypothetical protein